MLMKISTLVNFLVLEQTLFWLFLATASVAASEVKPADHLTYLPLISRSAPEVKNIREPLLIDGEEGRIYATATLNGVPWTVVLGTSDGHYLDSYPYAGRLAVDRNHHWLLIDRGDDGVVIVDSLNGHRLGVIYLPEYGTPPADPQIDADRGVAYVFRNHNVYTLNLEEKTIAGFRTLYVPLLVCGDLQGPAPITRSFYDGISNTLYISFNTWVCTGFLSDTIHIYDAASWYKWGEYSTPSQYQAVPFAANLYGFSQLTRLSMQVYWARSLTQTWYEENDGGNSVTLAGNVVDWSRGLLYEAIWEYKPNGEVDKLIRISLTSNRQLLTTVNYDHPPIQNARLAGHDPHTDQLYFLDEGTLHVLPTTSILPVGNQN